MPIKTIVDLLEKDYNTNEKFKNIIDKVKIIESIYKGLNKNDIPKIRQMIQLIKRDFETSPKIKFGSITYDKEDFLSISEDKIVETNDFKLKGLSYSNEKLVRKLCLHNKNLVESIKIVSEEIQNEECLKLFNVLLYACLSVYLIIGQNTVFIEHNVSNQTLKTVCEYKEIISEIINEA